MLLCYLVPMLPSPDQGSCVAHVDEVGAVRPDEDVGACVLTGAAEATAALATWTRPDVHMAASHYYYSSTSTVVP